MKNLKDTVTTICGILIAVSGTVYTLTQAGIVLPTQVTTIATAVGIIAMAVLGYFTGKNPDGTKKTSDQIDAQLKSKG